MNEALALVEAMRGRAVAELRLASHDRRHASAVELCGLVRHLDLVLEELRRGGPPATRQPLTPEIA